jgi:hypothetical protein
MKKIFIYIAAIASITVGSCKKDHSKGTDPTKELHNISFHVTGFSQQLANFSTAPTNTVKILNNVTNLSTTQALGDVFKSLNCLVYDASGKFLHLIHQASTESGFGSVTDNLAEGSYTFVFIGSKANITPPAYASTNLQNTYIATGGTSSGAMGVRQASDVFFKKVQISVGATNTVQNVTLDRIIGKIQLNIEDVLPASIVFITLSVSNGSPNFSIPLSAPAAGTTGGSFNYVNVTAADKGKPNYNNIAILALGNSNGTVSVTVSAYTEPYSPSPGFAYATKTISNVTCLPNTITLLTGPLFGGTKNNNDGFQPIIDTSWSKTPPITINF